jgi:hypothetical protein
MIIQVNVAQQHFYNYSRILKIKKAGFKKKLKQQVIMLFFILNFIVN